MLNSRCFENILLFRKIFSYRILQNYKNVFSDSSLKIYSIQNENILFFPLTILENFAVYKKIRVILMTRTLSRLKYSLQHRPHRRHEYFIE